MINDLPTSYALGSLFKPYAVSLYYLSYLLGVHLMAMHVFQTDRECNQAALDKAARFIFDRASEILSDGNPVADSVTALSVLSNTAVFAGYSNTSINVFFSILDDENAKNNDMGGY